MTSYLSAPLSCTQWAAVSSQRLLNTEAPHTWPVPRTWRLTCHGHSPSRDATPPTMRELRYRKLPQDPEGPWKALEDSYLKAWTVEPLKCLASTEFFE
ncbi:hypothetical protein EYF80_050838 [Liparis tanakae]|uniref:Uncharacterized protein n=1 Tax=Liparis tanakae TaxID=230148 RepID=A0A4Z2FCU5_9TELE|nr:hypothetical protein EYF80_050838 [Liparis tanakae]